MENLMKAIEQLIKKLEQTEQKRREPRINDIAFIDTVNYKVQSPDYNMAITRQIPQYGNDRLSHFLVF